MLYRAVTLWLWRALLPTESSCCCTDTTRASWRGLWCNISSGLPCSLSRLIPTALMEWRVNLCDSHTDEASLSSRSATSDLWSRLFSPCHRCYHGDDLTRNKQPPPSFEPHRRFYTAGIWSHVSWCFSFREAEEMLTEAVKSSPCSSRLFRHLCCWWHPVLEATHTHTHWQFPQCTSTQFLSVSIETSWAVQENPTASVPTDVFDKWTMTSQLVILRKLSDNFLSCLRQQKLGILSQSNIYFEP